MNLTHLFLTCKDKNEAEKIADKLLDKKLVACIKILPVKTKYFWNGKKESAEESLLIMDTIYKNFKKIENEIKKIHSYEAFVLTSSDIHNSSKGVEDWINKELKI